MVIKCYALGEHSGVLWAKNETFEEMFYSILQ